MKIGIGKHLLITIGFLVVTSCDSVKNSDTIDELNNNKESAKTVLKLPDNQSNEIIRMVEDTIRCFISHKSFTITGRKDFYPQLIRGFTINNQTFVASIIFGNDLIIHKRIGNAYKRIFYNENAGMDGYHVNIKIMDVNFDGYNDLVFSDIQGAWGNSFSTTFLYDLKQNTLKRAPQFDLRNLSLDEKNKLLRTHSYRGMCWTIDKELFKVVSGQS